MTLAESVYFTKALSAELEHETQLLANPGHHPAHRRRGLVALSAQPPLPHHHDHAAGEIIPQCEVTAATSCGPTPSAPCASQAGSSSAAPSSAARARKPSHY